MAGNYLNEPQWNSRADVQCAIGNLIRHHAASPQVVKRLQDIVAAYDFAREECEQFHGLLQRTENARANGAFDAEVVKDLRDLGEKLNVPPPALAPSQVYFNSMKALLGALVDDFDHATVAVALDEAVKDRTP